MDVITISKSSLYGYPVITKKGNAMIRLSAFGPFIVISKSSFNRLAHREGCTLTGVIEEITTDSDTYLRVEGDKVSKTPMKVFKSLRF
jgi:hypothetical protein